jgi:hypothetical protein
MKAQVELQTDAFLKAIATLTANQGAAAAAAEGPAEPAGVQGLQKAQNTQEPSRTTPVLFYQRCKDGSWKQDKPDTGGSPVCCCGLSNPA